MSIVVYMFHAIGAVSKEDWADPHYSCSKDVFIKTINALGLVSSIKDYAKNPYAKAIITFDDGHISNFDAAKYIYDQKLGTADFFINPEKVGEKFYMNWEQIKQLSNWGMSIQSHGLDHKYLSDCDDIELHRQLLLSKNLIEQKIDQPVCILAPPGGRYDRRVLNLSKKIGYKHIANSKPGMIKSHDQICIPRMAVLNHHSVNKILEMQYKFSFLNIKSAVKYGLLGVIKKILGNDAYDRIRWRILGEN